MIERDRLEPGSEGIEKRFSEAMQRYHYHYVGLDRAGELSGEDKPSLDLAKQREVERLVDLEQRMLDKLGGIASGQGVDIMPGLRGRVAGFSEVLEGGDGKAYKVEVCTDVQRMELIVSDLPGPVEGLIRKYRQFVGRFNMAGEETVCDLSCLGEKTFSWRRDASDNDHPEKSLSLKEACNFLKEILAAQPLSQRGGGNQIFLDK